MDQGTCTQNCYVLPDAYDFTTTCTDQNEYTLEQCSNDCDADPNCEGFNLLNAGGCEIVTSVTDSGAFYFVSSYDDNFHVKGLSNGADGLEPRIAFDAHHILTVAIDAANNAVIENSAINIDLTQVEDAFIATSQEKGLYEPEQVTWDSDCTKMQHGYCKTISQFHECANLCNSDSLCKGYLQVGDDQCQIVYDDSGITEDRLGSDTFWRQSGVADFCTIHTSATEIYVKLELSEYDAQLFDSHNTDPDGVYMYLPIEVNLMDASVVDHNKLYTKCPPGYALRLITESPINIQCLLFNPVNFPYSIFDDWWINNSSQGASQQWWTSDLTVLITNQDDGIDGVVPYSGCGKANDGSDNRPQMILRWSDDYTKFGCIAQRYYRNNCEGNTWGAQQNGGDTAWGNKLCGLNAECNVSEQCVVKSGVNADEYLVDSESLHFKFTPLNDASYIAAKDAYELNEDIGISTYGPMSSWDLSRVTTRPYLVFDDIWLNSGILGPVASTDTDKVVFRPQSFVRTTVDSKEYLEIRYFSKCVSESVFDATNQFVSFCRIDGDTDFADQDTDSVTSHSFLYGTNIVNIPINYKLNPGTENYRRAIMANTG